MLREMSNCMNSESIEAEIRICPVAEIGDSGKEAELVVNGERLRLMLFRREGIITAWHNVCPHKRRSLNLAPDRFLFNELGQLVCAQHGATFELPGGHCVAGPCQGAQLAAFPVCVKNGWAVLKTPG